MYKILIWQKHETGIHFPYVNDAGSGLLCSAKDKTQNHQNHGAGQKNGPAG